MLLPSITAWTVMPYRIVAKAWTDATFKTALLASPNTVIQSVIFDVPNGINFIIQQDTSTDRYLPLPYLDKSYTLWTQDQIFAKLLEETGANVNLQYCLPAVVTSKAYFDAIYKSTLLSATNTALNTAGTSAPAGITFHVNANTATDHNITLPLIPVDWIGLPYELILERLIFNGNQIFNFN